MNQPYLFISFDHLNRGKMTQKRFEQYCKSARIPKVSMIGDRMATFGINHIHHSHPVSFIAAEEGVAKFEFPTGRAEFIYRSQAYEEGGKNNLTAPLPKIDQVVVFKNLVVAASSTFVEWFYFLNNEDVSDRIFKGPRTLVKTARAMARRMMGVRAMQAQPPAPELFEQKPVVSRKHEFKLVDSKLYYLEGNERLVELDMEALHRHVSSPSDERPKQLADSWKRVVSSDALVFAVDRHRRIYFIEVDEKIRYLRALHDPELSVLLKKPCTQFMSIHREKVFTMNSTSDEGNPIYEIRLYNKSTGELIDNYQYGHKYDNTLKRREDACPARLHLFTNRRLLHGLVLFNGTSLAVFALFKDTLKNVGKVQLLRTIPQLRGILISRQAAGKIYLYDMNCIYRMKISF